MTEAEARLDLEALGALGQDELMVLPHALYGPRYLTKVYRRMAAFVPLHAEVVEIGVRPEDRGVLSPPLIPHRVFRTVDRRGGRGQERRDALASPIWGDVILSTCVLHHTPRTLIPTLLANLRAPLLMFTGPNAGVVPALFGDHLWHLEEEALRGWLCDLGYRVAVELSGLTEPFCELFVVARRP